MANPTNKSYDGIITWATGSSNDIQAKNLITARNIKLTNSSNTQLATASFNGTADATLKLAATVPISISGNAATATSATSATSAGTCTGNAATATKLKTARTISLTGAVTGSGSFDGGGNLSLSTAIGSVLTQALNSSNGCLGTGAFWEDGWIAGSWYFAHFDFNNNFRATKVGIPYGAYSGYDYGTSYDDISSDINTSSKIRVLIGDSFAGSWNNSSQGYSYSASGTKTVTFPLPFNYAPFWIWVSSKSRSEPLMWLSVKTITPTSFTYWWNGYNGRSTLEDCYWAAVGFIN